MSYNPDFHHRHSIRLKGYDYSENGLYFITICLQNRENLFGEIIGEHKDCPDMQINNAGKMIQKWWWKLENKFPNVILDEFVIMPNHFHGIIQIGEHTEYQNQHVGADLCVCPDDRIRVCPDAELQGQSQKIAPTEKYECQGEHTAECQGEHTAECQGEHIGSPLRNTLLPTIVQWFKTMTTNEYIRGVKSWIFPPFDKHVWQRNYYEHIIQNEAELNNIREYITNNPKNWENDSLFH